MAQQQKAAGSRVVFVTGGGTGLGLACASEFCSQGDHVCIGGRREGVLQKAIAQVKEKIPQAKIFYVTMDVRSVESVNAAVDTIVATAGALPSVILNNAAGNFISPSEKLSPNAWKSILDIVLYGGINVMTTVGKRWIAKREAGLEAPAAEPQVVFISVGTSYMTTGAPYLAPSAAAKAGILSINQSLAAEWGKYNIRFVMIAPGPIHTEGAMSRLDPMGMSNLTKGRPEIGKSVPLGYLIEPPEYSKFVSFVAGPGARWLTGTAVHYDGGAFANGGEFHELKEVTPEQWAMLEKMIRKTSNKQRSGKVQTSKL